MKLRHPSQIKIVIDPSENNFRLYRVLKRKGDVVFRSRHGTLTDAASWLSNDIGEKYTSINVSMSTLRYICNSQGQDEVVTEVVVDRTFDSLRELEIFISEYRKEPLPNDVITFARGTNNVKSELDFTNTFVLVRESGIILRGFKTVKQMTQYCQKKNIKVMFNGRELDSMGEWTAAYLSLEFP